MNGKTRSSFWPDRAYPINFNTKVEHSNPLSANFSKPLKDKRVGSSPPCALKNSALLRIRRTVALFPKIFRSGISQLSMPLGSAFVPEFGVAYNQGFTQKHPNWLHL